MKPYVVRACHYVVQLKYENNTNEYILFDFVLNISLIINYKYKAHCNEIF